MKVQLINLWETLRSSYWFVPTLMMFGAAGLTFVMIALDQEVEYKQIKGYWWIYTGGYDGGRAVLSTVAGSIMTVAGVTFSITIAALSLASQQFGPRLLRNFLRDTGNQLVLGTFLGTFLYCILILRTIRGSDVGEFVPHLAITVGVGLGIVSLGVLIFFIHHVSQSIQAAHVIKVVGRELDEAIDRMFPTRLGEGASKAPRARGEEDVPEDLEQAHYAAAAAASGYVQSVDSETLMGIAVEHEVLIALPCRPGHYAMEGNPLARVWPRGRGSEEIAGKINRAFLLGPQRTLTQDTEFGVDQLVEVAVRSLSTGINDPFTAMMCVDRLGASLSRLAGRELPSPYRYDDTGKLRVIADPVTFVGVADAAFHQIRQNARGSVAVMIRLLETITGVAAHVQRDEDRDALRRHADLIVRDSREHLAETDREDVEGRYQNAMRTLQNYGERE